MKTNWTPAQETAIKASGAVLVAASAGTGKTAVLTEKVVNQILDGVDVENILVMTFSTKAADEMKQRIADKLDKALAELDNEPSSKTRTARRKWIISQINSLNKANIQTIHSFCCDVIRSHFYKVGIDPKFKVCSGSDAIIIKRKAIDAVLDPYYNNPDDTFSDLFEYFGSNTIEDSIIDSHKQLLSILDGESWIDKETEKYNIDDTKIPEFVKTQLLTDFNRATKLLTEVKDSLSSSSDEKVKKPLATVSADINCINTAIEYVNKDYIIGINPYLFKLFGGTIRFPEGYEVEKSKRDAAKAIIKPYKDTFYMDRQLARIKSMYPAVKLYSKLLKAFDKAYKEEKRKMSVIDFSDMEHMAYEILSDAAIAESYRSQYRSVYVDEYQDTSPVQEAIVNSVSQKNNLFCVGDLKQSIYRFRSSDPLLFKERMDSYHSDKSKQVIHLNANFRSSANVLNCANDVFTHITQASDEISYTAGDSLIHNRADNGVDAPVYVDLISNEDCDKEEAEIANICRIIKNRVGKPIYDARKDIVRPAEYSDFAVLSRKVLKYTTKMTNIFQSNGIPFQIEKTGNLFNTAEIELVLAIFKLISNRNDDIGLITLAHNHIFDFTDDDILEIRKVDYDSSLMANIKTVSAGEGSLSDKCKALISFLDLCCEKQHHYSLPQLLNYVLNRTNLMDIVAVMENSAHRLENVKAFTEFAARYENSHHGKIWAFLKHIEHIRNDSETESEAKGTAASNAVTITSIHQSKGLEYPIVILAFMGTEFSSSSNKKPVIIDRDAGYGFKYFDSKKGEKGKNVLRTRIEEIVARKDKEEEMRLLYVAMTRAKEELYIQGIRGNIAPLEECDSMLSWVCSSVYDISSVDDETPLSTSSKLTGKWEIHHIIPSEIEEMLKSSSTTSPVNIPIKSVMPPAEKHVNKCIPVPIAISASAIDKMNTFSEEMLKTPAFMSEKKATDVGNSVHKFLRYTDFSKISSSSDVCKVANTLSSSGIISEEDALNVCRFKFGIAKMLNTEVFKRIASADKIYKEKHLYTRIPNPEDENTSIVVRCIADLAYEIDGSIVIIDYKTDKVSDCDLDSIVESHRKQLELYAKCFSDTFKKPVSGIYLGLVGTGQVVSI